MIITLNMNKDFEVGDSHEARIDGKMVMVEWLDEETLLIGGEKRPIIDYDDGCTLNFTEGVVQFRYEEPETAEELFAMLAKTLRDQGERYKRPELLEAEDIKTIFRAFQYRREEAAEVMRQIERGDPAGVMP